MYTKGRGEKRKIEGGGEDDSDLTRGEMRSKKKRKKKKGKSEGVRRKRRMRKRTRPGVEGGQSGWAG